MKKTNEQLVRIKKERLAYQNVFIEAMLSDIDYLSNDDIEEYYCSAEEIPIEQGEIYCFVESEKHESNFRFTARNDFNILVHQDKKGCVSVLVPLDNEKHIVVPTDNFIAANNEQLKAYCGSVRGRIKAPTTLIIKKTQ